MPQKQRGKAAEETVQPLQLTHRRYHSGTRRDLHFKERPSRRRQGCRTVHNPMSVCPSVLPLHWWLQARPGVLRVGVWGL